MNYYNEFDPFAAAWLRELIKAKLISDGEVDERSIEDVKPNELTGYKQCHFFAGIGVWSYALRQAGWPDDRPVWTGSCPCQPFSTATHGATTGLSDSRHLWPTWRKLIRESRPATVFGEQVSNAGSWFDEVCDDMETLDYSIGAAVLPACSVGKDHVRARLYFVCHSNLRSQPSRGLNAKTSGMSRYRSDATCVARADGSTNRVGKLRGYGNAIVAPVAQAFIEAYLETCTENGR